MKRLVGTTGDVTLVVGADWAVDYPNEAITECVGSPAEEIRGRSSNWPDSSSPALTASGSSGCSRRCSSAGCHRPWAGRHDARPHRVEGTDGLDGDRCVEDSGPGIDTPAQEGLLERNVTRSRASRYSAVETRFNPGSSASVAQNTGPPSQSLLVRRYQASR